MEVGRRPDEGSILWEGAITSNGCDNSCLKKTTTSAVANNSADATASSLDQRPTQRVTRSDIIDELLEIFQRKLVSSRRNGRVQSDTIWRNGTRVEQLMTY